MRCAPRAGPGRFDQRAVARIARPIGSPGLAPWRTKSISISSAITRRDRIMAGARPRRWPRAEKARDPDLASIPSSPRSSPVNFTRRMRGEISNASTTFSRPAAHRRPRPRDRNRPPKRTRFVGKSSHASRTLDCLRRLIERVGHGFHLARASSVRWATRRLSAVRRFSHARLQFRRGGVCWRGPWFSASTANRPSTSGLCASSTRVPSAVIA